MEKENTADRIKWQKIKGITVNHGYVSIELETGLILEISQTYCDGESDGMEVELIELKKVVLGTIK